MPYNLIMIFCPLFVNLFKKTGILPVFFVGRARFELACPPSLRSGAGKAGEGASQQTCQPNIRNKMYVGRQGFAPWKA